MPKRKNEDSGEHSNCVNISSPLSKINENIESFLLKKQRHEESLLYKLFLHPYVNRVAFRAFSSEELLCKMRLNNEFLRGIQEQVNELTLPITEVLNYIKRDQVFPKLKELCISNDYTSSCYQHSCTLSVQNFPLLKKVTLNKIDVTEVIITCPIHELIVHQRKESVYPIRVSHTLRKLEASTVAKFAFPLVFSQPYLHDLKLYLYSHQMDQKYYNFVFDNPCISKLHIHGSRFHRVCIFSLEDMKELYIRGCTVHVFNPTAYSNLRLLIIDSVRSIHPIVGSTKFPNLNLFLGGFRDDLDAHRIYRECMERDQNKITAYFTTITQTIKSRSQILYCNNVEGIYDVSLQHIISGQEEMIFLDNIPNLVSLTITHPIRAHHHIIPRSTNLKKLQLEISNSCMNSVCSLLENVRVDTLEDFTLVTTPYVWNSCSRDLLKNVTTLAFFLSSDHDEKHVAEFSIKDLMSLRSIIIRTEEGKDYQEYGENAADAAEYNNFGFEHFILHLSNLSSLSDIKFPDFPDGTKIIERPMQDGISMKITIINKEIADVFIQKLQ